mmetsp:Transcript_17167/g.25755  ORF Transcript_17167/g.25755 Transcript_17167/m.25755 type:complete len:315 (+) Transcript_17167:69-1013(+)
MSAASLSRDFEIRLAKSRNIAKPCIVGLDEAGRGPLAGPVVAAACHVPLGVEIKGVNDSKKVSEADRESIFEELRKHPKVRYAVCEVGPRKIEEINILHAAMLAMDTALETLVTQESDLQPNLILVDGPRLPVKVSQNKEVDSIAVVSGDSKSFSIAAASIIAKVTRDRIMVELDKKYPQYGLAKHKGYPTASHVATISKYGPTPIHRMTFRPLKTWYPPKEEESKPHKSAKKKGTNDKATLRIGGTKNSRTRSSRKANETVVKSSKKNSLANSRKSKRKRGSISRTRSKSLSSNSRRITRTRPLLSRACKNKL